MKKKLIILSAIVLTIILLIAIPLIKTNLEANNWYDNDKEYYIKYANTIDSLIRLDVTSDDMIILGTEGYSGELLFINYLMASLGYGQIIMEFPELKNKYIGSMEYCIDKMLTDQEVKSFDTDLWDEDPVHGVLNGTDKAHGAYLCYINVALSMHNLITENSKYKELNKKVTEHLVVQFNNSPVKLIESYPDDYYPADVSSAMGSLGLYAKATGIKYEETINQALIRFDTLYSGKQNGLIVHSVYLEGDHVVLGDERGASTALSSYMLSFVDKDLSKKLFVNMKKALYENNGIYAGIREYPRGVDGVADGDSGPIVKGLGVSASGFALAAAKVHNDNEVFSALYKTAAMVGNSTVADHYFEFERGAFIGNTILFAMLTSTNDI